jgi:hypothetical protein
MDCTASPTMPAASRIRLSQLPERLKLLDIDEGLRIEFAGSKMFVNKNLSGSFVVQFDNKKCQYLDSAKILKLAKKSSQIWAY